MLEKTEGIALRAAELTEISRQLEGAPPSEVLEWAVEAYGDRLTLSLSFGNAEGIVLLDMLSHITNKVRAFTLDTGFLFKETKQFREEIMQRYQLPLEVFHSRLTVAKQAEQYGDRLYARHPDLCCQMRKVEPQERALRGYEAWITGMRREQTLQRADTPVVGWEKRFEVAKIAPLAGWSHEQVEEYVREHDIPLNPLLDEGYRSIGCEPCTRQVAKGEGARAGRWSGSEKTECGLHWMGDRRSVEILGDVQILDKSQKPNEIEQTELEQKWKNKRVLITGACGTVGRELLGQVVEQGPSEVIALDNNESELFLISEEYRAEPHVRFYLGDLRDRDNLIRKMHGIDVVLHAAALKHVIICEESPRDAVQTNILGTQNVIDAALTNEVERVIFTSSDKAVNPTNVMGTSKLMGERLMAAANAVRRGERPVFASTRFGNVLGSRGSVIQVFKRQIAAGGPVTLTDPGMTRFIMTLEEAVRLVMESVFLAQGGEVFVTKMKALRIADLATAMIAELAPHYGHNPEDIETKMVGSKAGEKLYEELLNDEETRRTLELDQYFVIIPAFKSLYNSVKYAYPNVVRSNGIVCPYNSANEEPMAQEDLRQYLRQHGLLEGEDNHARIDSGRRRVPGLANSHGPYG